VGKIKKNWNISRLLYLAGGMFFVAVGLMDRAWFMIPVGVYLAGIAVFKVGCTGPTCARSVFNDSSEK